LKGLPSNEGICVRRHEVRGGYATVKFKVRSETDPGYANKWVECEVKDLVWADTGGMDIGCRVQLKTGLVRPTYGWGGVTPQCVGILLKKEHDMVVVRFPSHPSWKGLGDELQRVGGYTLADGSGPILQDLRIRASYPALGGILADKVGYGKTATMIALIDSTLEHPAPPVPELDRGSFIPSKATLVIVPSNLFEQWLMEISKFVCKDQASNKMKNGFSPKSWPWKVFAMSKVTPLTRVTAAELAEADVVLCSYRLLFSPIYQDRRKEIVFSSRNPRSPDLASLAARTREFMSGREAMSSGRKGEKMVATWQELEFPVLEMFYWRRVVFDEFHELESFESLQQNSLQHIRASYRWGLTGTPPVDCCAGVIFMASLFRIDLPGQLELEGAASKICNSYPNLHPWESDRLLAEVAGRFLDHFVRQNTAELPEIRLEEHVEVVQHNAAERALYLGQAHDAPGLDSQDAFTNDAHVQALERLLKLCSHFQAAGENMKSAKEECNRIGEQKERRAVKAENQLLRCAIVIAILEEKYREVVDPWANDTWSRELVKVEKQLRSEGDAGKRSADALTRATQEALQIATLDPASWPGNLEAHRPRNSQLQDKLGTALVDSRRGYAEQWRSFFEQRLQKQELHQLLVGQVQEQAANLKELHAANGSLEFFLRTVTTLANDSSPETRSCSVCLEEGLPLTRLALTPCAHAFCVSCLRMTIEKYNSCSMCRQPLSLKDVQPLEAELRPGLHKGTPQKPSSPSSSSSAVPFPAAVSDASGEGDMTRFSKYGTKLAAVVLKLQELRASDPQAKVILFVQFEDLKRKVASALNEFGVPTMQLQGSVAQRSGVVRDWQHNPTSASFVLLLSLAQSASGTNLTAASHVVFLHPMLAPTAERAVSFELQAIGRARRYGQRRDVVHVWRFVTAGTLEQAITERHQSALWAKEAGRRGSGVALIATDGPADAAAGSAATPAAAQDEVTEE